MEAAVLDAGALLTAAELACDLIDPSSYHVDYMETYVRPEPPPVEPVTVIPVSGFPEPVVTTSFSNEKDVFEFDSSTFEGSNFFVQTTTSRFCTIFLVGGGGGGGYSAGGGGGAGVVAEAYLYLPAGKYQVELGFGGAAGDTLAGSNGGFTSFQRVSDSGDQYEYMLVYGGGGGGGATTLGSTGGGDAVSTSNFKSVAAPAQISVLPGYENNMTSNSLYRSSGVSNYFTVSTRTMGGNARPHDPYPLQACGGGGGGASGSGGHATNANNGTGGTAGDGVEFYGRKFAYGGCGGTNNATSTTSLYGGSGGSTSAAATNPTVPGSGGGGGAGSGGTAGSAGFFRLCFWNIIQ